LSTPAPRQRELVISSHGGSSANSSAVVSGAQSRPASNVGAPTLISFSCPFSFSLHLWRSNFGRGIAPRAEPSSRRLCATSSPSSACGPPPSARDQPSSAEISLNKCESGMPLPPGHTLAVCAGVRVLAGFHSHKRTTPGPKSHRDSHTLHSTSSTPPPLDPGYPCSVLTNPHPERLAPG